MKNEKTILFWLFAGSAVAISLLVNMLSQPRAAAAYYLLAPVPMFLLSAWFYRITRGRSDSWLRLAAFSAILCYAIGDLGTAGRVNVDPESNSFLLAPYAACYVFYFAGYFSKAPLVNGYLHKHLYWIPFLLLQYIIVIVLLWGRLEGIDLIRMAYFSLFGLFLAAAIFNIRGSIAVQAWRWVITGLYFLVSADVCFAYNQMTDTSFGLALGFIGHYMLAVGTAKIVWSKS